MRNRKNAAVFLVILLFFALLSVFLTRPILTQGDHAVVGNPYDPTHQVWTIAWDLHALSENPLDLFDANIFYPNPYTLAYSDSQVVTAVLAAPVVAATGNPVQAANMMLIFHFLMASLGGYFLVRHLTGSRFAGVIAGIAFAYAPYKIAHLTHLNLLAVEWIPFALLFLHLYCEKGKTRDLALFALFFVLEALSAWSYAFMTALAVGLFLLVRLIVARKTYTLRWVVKLGVAVVVAGLLVLPFALPYLRVHSSEPEFEREISEVDFYAVDAQDFLMAPAESLVWGGLTAPLRRQAAFRGSATERAMFPGLVALVLGIAGAVYLFRRRRWKPENRFSFWFYITLPIVSGVLCLGPSLHLFGRSTNLPLPYRFLYYVVPGFKALRTPARFSVLIALSLAVLAGYAVKGLTDWLRGKDGVLLSALVGFALLTVLLLDVMTVAIPMARVPLADEFPPVYTWLEERPGDAPTVEVPLAGYRPSSASGIDELQWLELEPARTYYSTKHWKKLLNGFSAFIPRSYVDAARAMESFPSRNSIHFLEGLGVEYVLVHSAELEPGDLGRIEQWSREHGDIRRVFTSGDDYVYVLR
ncbi:MAG: hypothetical protein KKE36_06115 [Actinobacteria bacterium]|nr:hypothetical protein [Actinomycetota bacterium]